ncbi:MAG: helix-turn-helix transcriptional regulator [Flavobacteriales bacterium]
MHALAEELRRLRLEKKWSQEHVGMSIGLSQSQYCAYEHDAIPPLERLQALARLYGMPLKHFTDLLPAARQLQQPQHGAEKNANGTPSPPLENSSTNLDPPPSDWSEQLQRLSAGVEQLRQALDDFLRRIGGGGKSLAIRP